MGRGAAAAAAQHAPSPAGSWLRHIALHRWVVCMRNVAACGIIRCLQNVREWHHPHPVRAGLMAVRPRRQVWAPLTSAR